MTTKYDKNLFLGFDIGGSSVKWGYGNCQQGLLCFESVSILEKNLSGLQAVFAQIINEVHARLGLSNIKAIGIGSPGTIEQKSGKIQGINPNLQFWTELSPAILIDKKLKLPVFYDNDANLMCLGEASLQDASLDVIGITIGSGIGSGYVQKGEIFHGAHGFGMEFGHTSVVPNGELCNCGRRGCLEAYSSVDGLKRLAHTVLNYQDSQSWNLNRLLQHAEKDERLRELIWQGERFLALSLVNLCILLDPDLILLGGGGTDGGLYQIDVLDAYLSQHLPSINRQRCSLQRAILGNKAGVLGAIILAESKMV